MYNKLFSSVICLVYIENIYQADSVASKTELCNMKWLELFQIPEKVCKK